MQKTERAVIGFWVKDIAESCEVLEIARNVVASDKFQDTRSFLEAIDGYLNRVRASLYSIDRVLERSQKNH